MTEEGYEDGGGWRWEDTTATWGDLWRLVKGKAVDAVAVSKLIRKLEDEYEDEDEDEIDW